MFVFLKTQLSHNQQWKHHLHSWFRIYFYLSFYISAELQWYISSVGMLDVGCDVHILCMSRGNFSSSAYCKKRCLFRRDGKHSWLPSVALDWPQARPPCSFRRLAKPCRWEEAMFRFPGCKEEKEGETEPLPLPPPLSLFLLNCHRLVTGSCKDCGSCWFPNHGTTMNSYWWASPSINNIMSLFAWAQTESAKTLNCHHSVTRRDEDQLWLAAPIHTHSLRWQTFATTTRKLHFNYKDNKIIYITV